MKVLCTVHDSCSGVWNEPFPAVNTASAVRSFTDAVNKPGSDLHNHPEHFSVWEVGQWDGENGLFIPCEPRCLVRAIDVVTPNDAVINQLNMELETQ